LGDEEVVERVDQFVVLKGCCSEPDPAGVLVGGGRAITVGLGRDHLRIGFQVRVGRQRLPSALQLRGPSNPPGGCSD
jgi:hypothetical protein